ncbi:hypothetical protein ACJJTC_008433 [Scirpophaga incertulas]
MSFHRAALYKADNRPPRHERRGPRGGRRGTRRVYARRSTAVSTKSLSAGRTRRACTSRYNKGVRCVKRVPVTGARAMRPPAPSRASATCSRLTQRRQYNFDRVGVQSIIMGYLLMCYLAKRRRREQRRQPTSPYVMSRFINIKTQAVSTKSLSAATLHGSRAPCMYQSS